MKELQLAVIGLDISHVSRFRELLNDTDNPYHLSGARIVKAFPGGTEAFHLSASRVPEFSKEYADDKIELVQSLDELGGCDGYFLMSCVGDQHLEQFRKLLQYGKPVFIDKPLACSYQDARAIAELSRQYNVPVTTTSSFRFAKGIDDLLTEEDTQILACQAFGKMDIFDDYRDYFWYAVHGADILYRIMGCGCTAVQAVRGEPADLLVGHWADGRLGTILAKRGGRWGFGCTVLTDTGYRTGLAATQPPSYALLMEKLLNFFRTGEAPVPLDESLEIMAFIEAASRSRDDGGKLIHISDIINE